MTNSSEISRLTEMVEAIYVALVDNKKILRTATALSNRPGVKQLLNYLPGWVWQMDTEGRFTFFSTQFEELTHIPKTLLIGKTLDEIILAGQPVPIMISKHRNQVHQHRAFHNFEFGIEIADVTYWFDISGWPCRNDTGQYIGYVGIGHDISEAKRRLLIAIQQTELLARALDLLEVSVLILDEAECIYFYNEHWKALHREMPQQDCVKGVSYECYLASAIDHGLFPEALGRKRAFMTDRIAKNVRS